MELLRRRALLPSCLVLITVFLCLAGFTAASDFDEVEVISPSPLPTRFEQAMAEMAALSPEAKARLHSSRLSERMLLFSDDDGETREEEDDEAADGESGNGDVHRRQLAGTGRKQLGLRPPLLNSGPSMADVNNTFFRWDSVKANAFVDWRQTMYISPIQRQYQCGSCWSIVAVDSVAMMWAILNNTTPLLLSPQQVCDCATKQCCKGGWPDWAFSYILFNGGIESLDDYPYLGTDNIVCNVNASVPNAAQITGWELVPPYNAMALMKAVSMQPVVAFLSGNANDFQYYSSRDQVKIYDGTCTTDINHAVIVVGYNYTGPGLVGSYWILKNSWFGTWGDAGYMYLAMTPDVRGKCGLYAIPAMYPVYYPGPAPVKIANGPFGRNRDELYDGKWWARAYTGPVDACAGLINPCGGGRCYTLRGIARCDCRYLTNMVEVLSTPTAKCVPRYPCASRELFNPCGSGVCRNPGDGTYMCECPAGYAIGTASDGTITCVGVGTTAVVGQTYTTIPGDSCTIVSNAFKIPLATLMELNPFLDCALMYIAPGMVLMVSSVAANTNTYVCTSTYTVQLGDSCQALANTYFSGNLTLLRAANPLVCTAERMNLLPLQQLCISTTSPNSLITVPQCGQTYTSVAGDTCATIATKYNIALSSFMSLNPALSCDVDLKIGLYLCVAPKSSLTVINCTGWYTVLQGDNCPNIWNAANLTEPLFLAINPGIRCQAPYLQVGQQVCIQSPILASLTAQTNTSFSLYTVQTGDTLALISSLFITRCTPVSVSPSTIAAKNNILETSPLVTNTTLIIPCDSRVGILDCGCAQSLPVCGADYVTYPSYCDAMCNYALPVIQDGACSGCNAACTNRVGLAPLAGYGCTFATCPQPQWPPVPTDCEIMVGQEVGKCCTFVTTTCENVCTAVKITMGGTSTQQTTNYNTCYANCMCCTRLPCAAAVCQAASSCWSASPRKCTYTSYKYWWNCTYFPPADPLP